MTKSIFPKGAFDHGNVILAVIFVLAFRSTAKEMKKGGCAYCASAMKEAHLEGEMTSAPCGGNCAHCSRRCH